MNTGKIVQVSGPVVDVEFENDDLPAIRDALEVMNGDKKCVMEVAQHIGNHIVRCIMLAASEGLCRDMEVVATGSGIKVPVARDGYRFTKWGALGMKSRAALFAASLIWSGVLKSGSPTLRLITSTP